jgi:hypothetical protein
MTVYDECVLWPSVNPTSQRLPANHPVRRGQPATISAQPRTVAKGGVMNILGMKVQLPRFLSGPRHSSGTMTYSESVAPLTGRRTVGFVMFSTLARDEERAAHYRGAIPKRDALMSALQSEDLRFRAIKEETALYFSNREYYAEHRITAERDLADLDYLLFLAVTHEPMPGSNILQDTLRPRLYNGQCQLVKRMEECCWTNQAVQSELQTFIESLARAMRMEMRAIVRRQETGKRTEAPIAV